MEIPTAPGLPMAVTGADAVRLEVTDPSQPESDLRMNVNNLWNYRNLGLGNYTRRRVIVKSGYSNAVRIRLADRAEANSP